MRAVWSFWSTPFATTGLKAWGSAETHLMAWALSFETARRHHPETRLVTDSAGARMLVDGLGLEFSDVSLALDGYAGLDPGWWSAGKFTAMALQDAPFVHIDADVFLWAPLPDRLTRAPVLAQNPEPFGPGFSWYDPHAFADALTAAPTGWLPPEWPWPTAATALPRGECCGIVGGTDVGLLNDWCSQALRLLRHPGNQPALARLAPKDRLVITLEQYLLATMIEHRGTRIAYLFEDWQAAATTPQRDYTHLISTSKRHPQTASRLRARLAVDHPRRLERIERWLRHDRAA